MPDRHQLVVYRRSEKVGDAELEQPIGNGKHHAVTKFHVQHSAIEVATVEHAQCLEDTVGVGDLIAFVGQGLFHQISQIELVFHKEQAR
ncbi:hypothetical protein D3C81_1073590 [compost metagenome]